MSNKKQSYSALSEELTEIMQRIDSVDDIDELVELHSRAKKIISKMQQRLENAKITMSKVENATS